MDRCFASTLSELRKIRGLSQRTVAADMHISQALLSHYENGAREPGLGFVCRICDYYGVSADYILCRSDTEAGGAGDGGGRSGMAYAALLAALRESDDAELSGAADSYAAAALLKITALITGEGLPRSACELGAEMAVCELAADRRIRRILAERNRLPSATLAARSEIASAGERIGLRLSPSVTAQE